jgi:hypothetical protein
VPARCSGSAANCTLARLSRSEIASVCESAAGAQAGQKSPFRWGLIATAWLKGLARRSIDLAARWLLLLPPRGRACGATTFSQRISVPRRATLTSAAGPYLPSGPANGRGPYYCHGSWDLFRPPIYALSHCLRPFPLPLSSLPAVHTTDIELFSGSPSSRHLLLDKSEATPQGSSSPRSSVSARPEFATVRYHSSSLRIASQC